MAPYQTQLVHLEDIEPRVGFAAKWQRIRHRKAHWAAEMLAEMTGVFLYCYFGGSASAAFIFGNIAGLVGVGSLLTAGLGYAIGVVLAIVICSATSGGHFNPCMTVVFMLFKKFPVAKGARYILAQIIGAYIAFAFLYLTYKPTIALLEHGLHLKKVYEHTMFTPFGPAGAFALYPPAGYSSGTLFLNEFVIDFILSLAIFASVDPTNLIVSPGMAPWVVGLAYAFAICGFVPNGFAANTARDLGGRLFAVTIWGKDAWGGSYAAIAAFTNIPATILGALFYNFVLADSLRVVNPASQFFGDAHHAYAERLQRIQGGHEDVASSDDANSTDKV